MTEQGNMNDVADQNNGAMDFDALEFSDNGDPRCPVVVVCDVSDSMAQVMPGEDRSPLEALNGGLDTLIKELHKDPLAKRRVEVSVVSFGTHVSPATEFATVENLILPTLVPSGVTSMGGAVVAALDAIEERKRSYKSNGIQYYRPWILLITDGLPTDDISEATQRVKEAEDKKSIAFFAVGVEGADMEILNKFGNREAVGLSGLKFDELFQWLSASQTAVSASNPGDNVAFPSPAGWAELD